MFKLDSRLNYIIFSVYV